MASLACYLKDLGNDVIGSDTDTYYFTMDNLIIKNIKILSFNKDNIKNKYIYIIGNAYDKNNIEVSKIINNKYEYYYYHEFISKFIKKDLICISGTHGKTTTASLLSKMLDNKVSYIIGDGSGYGTEITNYLILEACEYKEHFLSYIPKIALITNIELDHPDYFKSKVQLEETFLKFAEKSEILILNNDELSTKYLKHKNKITFGFDKSSDYVINIIDETNNGYNVIIKEKKNNKKYNCFLPFLGKHLIYDFCGAFIICLIIGINPIITNLTLPKRRMTTYKYGKTILIDDYAHHPTEIKCLETSLRKTYPNKKINVIFQSHTYSRTIKFKNEFKKVLKLFDKVYIENVFSSKREKENLILEQEINDFFNEFEKFNINVIKEINQNKDEIWVFLGAGTVNKYIDLLINNKFII